MTEGTPAASKRPAAGLVELERELEGLLVEYESLSRAWPKEPRILTRATLGRRVQRLCALPARRATPIDTSQHSSVSIRFFAQCDSKGHPPNR